MWLLLANIWLDPHPGEAGFIADEQKNTLPGDDSKATVKPGIKKETAKIK